MTPPLAPTSSPECAFLRSVIYASIFDYPLTLAQLHESLIGHATDAATLAAWYESSPLLQAAIDHRDGYYFPRGRLDLLEIRQKREALSRDALEDLSGPLGLVRRMPFVRMVALSGSLAHLNAHGETDLDLFVITAPGRVWSVTTTLLVVARLRGWRRQLCLNYVISERQLEVEARDLFSANQIVHLRPLAGADVYRRFLRANPFVAAFYPNFQPRTIAEPGPPIGSHPAIGREATIRRDPAIGNLLEWLLDHTLAPLYERLCRRAYGWHLGRRAHTWHSREQVRLEPECLKLHTSSHRRDVMGRFERAISDVDARLAAASQVSGVRGQGSGRYQGQVSAGISRYQVSGQRGTLIPDP